MTVICTFLILVCTFLILVCTFLILVCTFVYFFTFLLFYFFTFLLFYFFYLSIHFCNDLNGQQSLPVHTKLPENVELNTTTYNDI